MQSLPTYFDIKQALPLTLSQALSIEQHRQTVRDILSGKDSRLIMIVGPCSIHDFHSAREYALRLKEMSEKYSSQFFFIMRVYCEKPRTTSGWRGFLYDPHLDGSHSTALGIEWTRQLMLDLTSLNIPTATEFLDPMTAFYYEDLVTWGSIGARTASSQTHRILASFLPMPVGIKNCLAGNISSAIHGALSATHAHSFMRISDHGKPITCHTHGNPDAHIVLRGGESGPNYNPESIEEALMKLGCVKLPQRLLIDCAHHNSNKKHERQPIAFKSIIHQILEGNTNIRGLMLESHLFSGAQALSKELKYGVSITDPCLSWDETVHLFEWSSHILEEAFKPCGFR